jgi:hypothetical protein
MVTIRSETVFAAKEEIILIVERECVLGKVRAEAEEIVVLHSQRTKK